MLAKEPFYMNLKYFYRIAMLLVILFIGKQILDDGVADAKKIELWPEDKQGNRIVHCNITNYQNCKKNQWFGIERHRSIEKISPKLSLSIDRLIDTICQPRSDPPSSTQLRVIKINSETNLVMCRLREPKEIDRGKVLKFSEDTPYFRIL